MGENRGENWSETTVGHAYQTVVRRKSMTRNSNMPSFSNNSSNSSNSARSFGGKAGKYVIPKPKVASYGILAENQE